MGVLGKKKGGTKPGKSKGRTIRSAKGSKKPSKGGKAKKFAKGLLGGATEKWVGYDVTTPLGGGDGMRRRRRINPMNAKATRKAATRVRASLNMLRRLERSLPHITSKGRVVKGKRKR
jgi:hypothetical protein